MMRRTTSIAAALAVLLVAVGALIAPSGRLAAADPLPPDIKPDAVLSPGETFTLKSTNVNVSDPLFFHDPAECREPPYDLTCDVVRIKLNRDLSPDALNFVFFSLEFEPTAVTPEAGIIAAGLNGLPVGDLDVRVWDATDHYLGQNFPGSGGDIPFLLELAKTTPARPAAELLEPILLGEDAGDPEDFPPGGNGINIPERGGFTAKKDVYDLVISASTGTNSGYTLRVGFSNEKFATPFEVLDPENTTPTPGFGSDPGELPDDVTTPGTGAGAGPDLTLPEADVAPDSDLAGIGLGINERFDAPPQFAFSGARNVASTPKPPSGLALVLGLVVGPLALGVGGALLLRRRRQALI